MADLLNHRVQTNDTHVLTHQLLQGGHSLQKLLEDLPPIRLPNVPMVKHLVLLLLKNRCVEMNKLLMTLWLLLLLFLHYLLGNFGLLWTLIWDFFF